ncbi:MAG: YncE family protein, partial [Isosphaeraceae bacterium]
MSTQGRYSRTAVALGVLSTIIVAAAIPSLRTKLSGAEVAPSSSPAAKDDPHRSPLALALSSDGSRLLVANQTAGSVSLLDTASGKVLHELATGDKPAGVAISSDGTRGVVTHWFGYDLALLKIDHDRMTITGRVEVGPEPRGVVLDQGGKTAFVAVGAANEVAKVDLETMRVSARVAVGREPRGLALSPDGSILLVGNARSQEVSVISTRSLGVFRTIPIEGDNLRQVAISADGKRGYIANMKNRGFATTSNNIDLGWVLGQRLTRVDLDTAEPSFATLSLDPRGKAAADAHGV